jgi:hypothetical protein
MEAITEAEQPASARRRQAALRTKPAAAPPSSWSREAKAEWPNLSDVVQAAALKRETEISQGFARIGEKERAVQAALEAAAKFDLVQKACEPLAQLMQQMNLDEAGICEQACILYGSLLGPHRLDALRLLAQRFGINAMIVPDPSGFMPPPPAQQTGVSP